MIKDKSMSSVIFQIQSVLIVCLMLFGVSKVIRRRKEVYQHIKIMKTVIAWDLLLIVQIELSRGAIETASKVMDNKILLNVHVLLALTTVLLYFLLYLSGKNVLSERDKHLRAHRIMGFCALTARLATLITSFWIL